MQVNTPNVRASLDTSRFTNQFKRAQKELNSLVTADCMPYIPFQQGQLRSQVHYPNGIYGDVIEWYAPYAHYMYKGNLYLAQNGSAYAKRGEVKYDSGKKLQYHEPGTSAMWFEVAKKNHKAEWMRKVKNIGGGGNA